MEKVAEILRKLRDEEPIPEINRPHLLTGNYAGCMECHIEGDFLLIWVDENEKTVGVRVLTPIWNYSDNVIVTVSRRYGYHYDRLRHNFGN